ncbi:hypothetical protein Bbelb_253800 [Branchiostoma belcheri]|nr:hypothetical protein Bbelb_253800 [Branchiostoma belcheri]
MDDRQGGDTDSAPSKFRRFWKDRVRYTQSKDKTPQHIIFKLNSYQDKVNIMKVARVKLKDENFYVTVDLTATDLQEKRKWRENVKQTYERGLKYRFYNGYWRDGKGKSVSF